MAFQTKITRARFVVGPFSSEQMQMVATYTLNSIAWRISRGENCEDAAAKPLKPGKNGKRGYPDYKVARGLQPIRDWKWTGKTLRALKVKSASENRAVIGFIDPKADSIAHWNNQREKQFGMSPRDEKELIRAVREISKQARVVRTEKVAA
jgi:hypothetical protein